MPYDEALRQLSTALSSVTAAAKAIGFSGLLAVLLPYSMWSVHAFDLVGLDDVLSEQAMKFVARRVDIASTKVRIIRIKPPSDGVELSSLRQYHGHLLDALASAGARAVIFDADFNRTTEHDQEFAAAIRRAGTRGLSVVLGAATTEVVSLARKPIIAKELRKVVDSGHSDWGSIRPRAFSRGKVRWWAYQLVDFTAPRGSKGASSAVGVGTAEVPVVSLALRGAMTAERLRLRIDVPDRLISLQSAGEWSDVHLTNRGEVFVPPFNERELDLLAEDYERVLGAAGDLEFLRSRFADSIVVVGFPGDIVRDAEGGSEYVGYQLQANALASLLGGAVYTPAGNLSMLLATVASALLGIACTRFSGPGVDLEAPFILKVGVKVDLGLVVCVALLVGLLILAMRIDRVMIPLLYPLLTILLTYRAGRRRQRTQSNTLAQGGL